MRYVRGREDWEAESELIMAVFGSEEAFGNALDEQDPSAKEFQRVAKLATDSRTRIELKGLVDKVNSALEELRDYDTSDYFAPALNTTIEKLSGDLHGWRNEDLYDLIRDSITFLTKPRDDDDEIPEDDPRRTRNTKVGEARLNSFVAAIRVAIDWTPKKAEQFGTTEEEEQGETGEPETEGDELAAAKNALPASPSMSRNRDEGAGIGAKFRSLIGR